MRLSDFDYQLPENLIAHYPLAERSASRLLVLNRANNSIKHHSFVDLIDLLKPGDLLVFNDTRVIPARLAAKKISGGKAEILIERILESHKALAHLRSNKRIKVDSYLLLENNVKVKIIERQNDLFLLHFESEASIPEILRDIGHIPLPPYITRADETLDKERYQTVFAEYEGAVAAPTAGLHFTDEILDKLRAKNVEMVFVTLHVGSGTFIPVRTDDILQHRMHSEAIEVSATAAEHINKAKQEGRRVIAVGTTVVRCLETAAQEGILKPYMGETNIFIYPGYRFRYVDALITNFHAPRSTLLMLISAFANYDLIMQAYQAAIAHNYRFLSYGDAMFIE